MHLFLPGGLNISPDGNTITLDPTNLPVVDQPRWPALDSVATPAPMTCKMVWKSTGEPVLYENTAEQFRFKGTKAGCQWEAEVEVPSIGLRWKSDPLDTSHAGFAVVGEETNGRY